MKEPRAFGFRCRSYAKDNETSYSWFLSMKHLFKNIGEEEHPIYSKDTPQCRINTTNWGPIRVNKSRIPLDWVEAQHQDVKPGGFYAPAHCRSRYRVAIFVPYRNREKNLIIFLYYIHRLLKKRLQEYRIFVIEQYGTEKWNKGTLYNLAYLESQRFGTWDCLIFHDVDLIPEDDRIFYSCSNNPVHLSSAVESHGYMVPYRRIFGGVTGLTPAQYLTVNGYSNFYWNWGGEDDDMLISSPAAIFHNLDRVIQVLLRYFVPGPAKMQKSGSSVAMFARKFLKSLLWGILHACSMGFRSEQKYRKPTLVFVRDFLSRVLEYEAVCERESYLHAAFSSQFGHSQATGALTGASEPTAWP
ncbi:beta-1,4-galactosyltransferase 4-like [Anticarsia gemmatalis]|uniref:beta-1,4-galactosyltransferase 4-like n=1 Tax=Anticarsia gemmatalis TaxID=129554 RepID=UPI003F75FED5